jgi:small subunit ribosomal protein S6
VSVQITTWWLLRVKEIAATSSSEVRSLSVQTYEAMFLLDSTKASVNWDETVQQIHEILTRQKAEIVASRQWDERRLAYAVDGHRKGVYLLTYFKVDSLALATISHDCRLNDTILREMILKIHPKLVEPLIESAMNSTPSVEEERRGEDEYEERPRRRRRDDA